MIEDQTTREEMQKQLACLAESIDKLATWKSALQEGTERWLQRIAEGVLEQMLQSPQQTEVYCAHDNPDYRLAALHLMVRHWPLTENGKQLCINMAMTDSASTVREFAIQYIGQCYYASNNGAVGCMLADLVCNSEESVDLRLQAYRALIALGPKHDDYAARFGRLTFPEGIDWDYVRSYVK